MLCTSACETASQEDRPPRPAHVIIFGVDGLSPLGIEATATPNIDRMIAEGAYSENAAAVIPTVSSPNWASLLTGATPEDHGIFNNGWDLFGAKPSYKGTRGRFPTLFGELRDRVPGIHMASFLDWGDFAKLIEDGVADLIVDTAGPDDTVDQAVAYFRTGRPEITMIHIDQVDAALHSKGFLSPEYMAAVIKADEVLGRLVAALEAEGVLNQTLIILTSDHGGKDFGHGGTSLQEITIPWIIRGPGVRKGHKLQKSVRIYDTAPTILYALGVEQPPYWTGIPAREAFE